MSGTPHHRSILLLVGGRNVQRLHIAFLTGRREPPRNAFGKRGRPKKGEEKVANSHIKTSSLSSTSRVRIHARLRRDRPDLAARQSSLSTTWHFVRWSFDVHTPITEIEDVSFVVLSPVRSRDRTGVPCIAEPAQWIMAGRPPIKHARPVVLDVVNNGIGKSHARIVNNIAHGTRAGNVLCHRNISCKGSRDD